MRRLKKYSFFFGVFALSLFVHISASLGQQYLINFDDLEEGYAFSATNQAYQILDPVERHGITINEGGFGVPTVVLPRWGARSSPHALRNEPTGDVGSYGESIDIRLQGFTSGYARVYVGLEHRSPDPVTAYLEAWQGGDNIDTDQVNLGHGPLLLEHLLEVEAGEDQAIDRIVISYGRTGSSSRNDVGVSELIDSLLIRVREGPPLPPPDDTTPPVVHIDHPRDGDTVSNGVVMGHVEEDIELDQVTVNGVRSFLRGPEVVGGSVRYYFVAEVDLIEGRNTIRARAVDRAGLDDTEEIEVIYDPPDYHPPPPVWPDTLDFEASGMEVTQAIQGWDMIGPTDALIDNEVPLVAGKKTLVRVYGTVTGITTSVSNVGCMLRAYSDASRTSELSGSPLYASDRVTLVPGENYVQQRPDPDKSFNFILPPEWTVPGTIYLRATVNHFAGIPEARFDVRNDTDVYDIAFQDTDTFCVLVYPIRSRNHAGLDATPTWDECLDNVSLLRQICPVSPDRLSVNLARRLRTDTVVDAGLDGLFSSDPTAGGTDDDLFDLLHAFRRHLGFYYGQAYGLPCMHAVYLGLTDETVTHRGVTDGVFPVSLSVASDDPFFRMKTGHESGHAQGLGHVRGCDAPAPDHESYDTYRDPSGTLLPRQSIGDWGVDIHDNNTFDTLDPEDYGDMMSYCGDRWISVYTWDWLYGHFTSFTPASAFPRALLENSPYLIIGGGIRPDGSATMDPVWRQDLSSGSSDHSGEGSFTLQLLDDTGGVLFERRFDPRTLADLEGYRTFYELVPANANTRTIRLLGPSSEELASVSAGPTSPQVRVISPNGGEQWAATGERRISWSGTDADGDSLTYTVFFSNDSGATWQVVAEGLTNLSTVVLLDDLPGGNGSCFVRVIVSDGINQGEDRSDGPFTKEGQPPLVRIESPRPAGVFSQGELIIFEGIATDFEDSSIASENLRWSSDRDGPLGTGPIISSAALSPGLHLIQLAVRDSEGMTARDVVPVFIRLPEILPDIDINGLDDPVTLSQGDPVSVTFSLDAGNAVGVGSDWWLLAATPFGFFHFDIFSRAWVPGWGMTDYTFQGPLLNVPDLEVFQLSPQPEPPDIVLPTGNYFFFFVVDTVMNGALDPGHLQYDYVSARVLEVTPVPTELPDVTVTAIDCSNGLLSVTMANIGSADISANAVGGLNLWIDGDLKGTYSWSTWNCQDFRNAGGSCVIQPPVLTGTHMVRACMDPDGVLTESNENNNCMEVQLCCNLPDLTASVSLSGQTVAAPGEALQNRLSVSVRNVGTEDAGQFPVGLYLSQDSTITTNDTLLIGGRESVSSLTAGQSTQVTLNGSMTIPQNTPPGVYYLGVLADEFNAVQECDEDNNDGGVQITVK